MEGINSSLNLSEITAPPETKMYDNTKENSYGIKHIMQGFVRTFKEPPGSSQEIVEGTLLWFMPGNIKAHVAKQNLTGNKINIIGQQCYELDRENHLLNFLPEAIEQTEALKKNLENEFVYDQHGNIADLSGIGIALQQMKRSLPGHSEYFKKLAKNLYEDGVTLVESETHSTRDGVTPVALIVGAAKK